MTFRETLWWNRENGDFWNIEPVSNHLGTLVIDPKCNSFLFLKIINYFILKKEFDKIKLKDIK